MSEEFSMPFSLNASASGARRAVGARLKYCSTPAILAQSSHGPSRASSRLGYRTLGADGATLKTCSARVNKPRRFRWSYAQNPNLRGGRAKLDASVGAEQSSMPATVDAARHWSNWVQYSTCSPSAINTVETVTPTVGRFRWSYAQNPNLTPFQSTTIDSRPLVHLLHHNDSRSLDSRKC